MYFVKTRTTIYNLSKFESMTLEFGHDDPDTLYLILTKSQLQLEDEIIDEIYREKEHDLSFYDKFMELVYDRLKNTHFVDIQDIIDTIEMNETYK